MDLSKCRISVQTNNKLICFWHVALCTNFCDKETGLFKYMGVVIIFMDHPIHVCGNIFETFLKCQ